MNVMNFNTNTEGNMSKTITTIERSMLDGLDGEILATLEAFAKERGLEVSIGGGKFDTTVYSPGITFKVAGGDKITWEKYAASYGLEASDFGREFSTEDGRVFKLAGLKLSARVRPILATEVGTDRGFAFPAMLVKSALTQKAEVAA